MFAQVTRLSHWKSEHDEMTCEDACKDDSLHGLFALSDGAGTTLFSNVWAQVLVDQFINLPLLSDDPFEVEWWVRMAQERYKERISAFGTMAWNVVQKAQSEGSYATLATLRISETHSASAKAELLITGDSCVFVEDSVTGSVQVFPPLQESDFDRPPICFPSKLSLFNRYFHRSCPWYLDVVSGDTVVLATDAVARWIISAGKGRHPNVVEALREVMLQTPLTWEQFILNCRLQKEMVDDDSTALIISFSKDTQLQGSYLLLGATTQHSQQARTQRKELFEQAVHGHNKELMAIYYGDGKMLSLEGMTLSPAELQQVRRTADALREVLAVLREVLNRPDAVDRIRPVWQKYASVLALEPCADALRQTLTRMGVFQPLPAVQSPTEEHPFEPARPLEAGDSALSLPNADVQGHEMAQVAEAGSVAQLKVSHEREKLALGKKLFYALRAEDDELIIEIHQAILQSPYVKEIIFSLEDEQRIEHAQQRHTMKQFVGTAIDQGNIQQMAHAYPMALKIPLAFSEDELKRLELASRFDNAYKTNNDDLLIATFEEVLHSPYHGFFAFSPQEEALVTQAWQRKVQQTALFFSEREATSPTISDAWFRKICQIKRLYLLQKQQPIPVFEQLQAQVVEDLANDQYIQEAIEELNRKFGRKIVNTEGLVKKEFDALRSMPSLDYTTFCTTYQLSDDEVKAALCMFLRVQLLAHYLHQENIELQDWLALRKSEGKTSYSHLAAIKNAKRSKLLWWRR